MRRVIWTVFAGVAAGAAIVAALLLQLGVPGGDEGPRKFARAPVSTMPAATITRIAAAGDTGTGPGSAIEATVSEMVDQDRQHSYDGLVLLGDLIYPKGDSYQVRSRILDVFSPLTSRGVRLLPVLGNHDHMSDEESEILEALGRDRAWYVERVGNVRVVVLDTEQVDDPAQTVWLKETLASPTPAPWTIVAMHKPAYSAGAHGSDEAVQQAWVPLFNQYEVPLVLAGHDHDYQRSHPIEGVVYVVSGGAATLRRTGREEFTAVSASVRHYVDLLVSADRLTGRALDQDGRLIDSFQLKR